MGQPAVRRLGAASDGHLSVAIRSVVLAVRAVAGTGLGCSPTVDRHAVVRRWSRCALGRPPSRPRRRRRHHCRLRLPALAVHPAVPVAHVADAVAVGGGRLAGRADGAVRDPHEVARPGDLRVGDLHGRVPQRDGTGDDRAGSGVVAGSRGMAALDLVATGNRRGIADRWVEPGRVAVVDRHAGRAGSPRCRCVVVLGDVGGGVVHLGQHRDVARPRLLAVLHPRPNGLRHERLGRLSGIRAGHRHRVPPHDVLRGGDRTHAMEPAPLRSIARARRHRAGCRRAPHRRSLAVDVSAGHLVALDSVAGGPQQHEGAAVEQPRSRPGRGGAGHRRIHGDRSPAAAPAPVGTVDRDLVSGPQPACSVRRWFRRPGAGA